MKWLINTYDPTREDAKYRLVVSLDKSRDEVWWHQQAYLADKIIGAPKATPRYTVSELEAMHFVGVYEA